LKYLHTALAYGRRYSLLQSGSNNIGGVGDIDVNADSSKSPFRRKILAWANREAHLTKAGTKIFDFSRFDSRRLATIPMHIERITSKPGNSENPDLKQLGHMVPKFQFASRDVPDRLGPQRYPFTALPVERVLNMASNWGRYGADTTMSNQSALYTAHVDDEFT
jgi:hypothetical protein